MNMSGLNRILNKYWIAFASLIAATPLVLMVLINAPGVGY